MNECLTGRNETSTNLTSGDWDWKTRVGFVLVLVFAFGFCFSCGLRGLFPLDQSIAFDGGYRVYMGQVPYRDFFIPYGPVVFWIQAAAFYVMGVNYYAHAFAAAVLNVIGTACSFVMVRILCRRDRWLAIPAALLTAVWLYSPFGTTYPEQTVFCTMLIGLSLVLTDLSGDRITPVPRYAALRLFCAGFFAVMGVLSKHNGGLPAIGIYVLIIVVMYLPDSRAMMKSLAFFGLGVVVSSVAFAGWLFLYSDVSAFVFHVITIPKQIGAERLVAGGWGQLIRGILVSTKCNLVIRLLLFAWGILFLGSVVKQWIGRPQSDQDRRIPLISAVLGISLIGFQNLFSIVSLNSGNNERPFFGILFALSFSLLRSVGAEVMEGKEASAGRNTIGVFRYWNAIALLLLMVGLSYVLADKAIICGAIFAMVMASSKGWFHAHSPGSLLAKVHDRFPPKSTDIGMYLVFGYLVWSGVTVSVYRQVHDAFLQSPKLPVVFALFYHSKFEDQPSASGLKGLRWANPTKIGLKQTQEITIENLDEVTAYLTRRPKPFFTFPDCTFLYPAVGSPSPQPMLWFHRGLTYPKQYLESLDQKIVDSLEKKQVQTILLEKEGFFGTQDEYMNDFPLLKQYLAEKFEFDQQIGFFQGLRLRESPTVRVD